MKELKVDERVENIGIDGVKIIIPVFKGGKNHIYKDLNNRKKMNKINIPYGKNKDNCFSLSMKDDSQGYGLLLDLSFPKFYEEHNLYFTEVMKVKEILKIINKKLKKIGFITKIKKYEVLDLEFGFNVVNSDVSFEQKTLFRHISSGLNSKYKVYSTANREPFLRDEDNVEVTTGFSALKGYKRFKIYCKGSEMLEKIKMVLNKNITRVEIMISGHEFIKRIGSRNLLRILKSVPFVFKDKMEEAFKEINKNNKKCKKYMKEKIREFRASGKKGLIKYILKFNFLDKENIIDLIREMNKELNYHGAEYIRKIEKSHKGKIDKFLEIKNKLSIFFHSINSIMECVEDGVKNVLDTVNKGVETILNIENKNEKLTRVKSEGYLLKPSLE